MKPDGRGQAPFEAGPPGGGGGSGSLVRNDVERDDGLFREDAGNDILVVDDHALFRHGLAMLLADIYADVEIKQASSVELALEVIENNGTPSLVLLDMMMNGTDGLDGLDQLTDHLPGVPIVIVSALESQADIRAALRHGAKGYIVKSSTVEVLEIALRLVLSGETYVPALAVASGDFDSTGDFGSSTTAGAMDRSSNPLTPRQTQVLMLLAQGQSNKEIARNLNMLEGTTKVHVKSIIRKLGVKNRTGAVITGVRMGYIPRSVIC